MKAWKWPSITQWALPRSAPTRTKIEADKIGFTVFLSDWLDLMPDKMVKDLLEMASEELAELAKEFADPPETSPRPVRPKRFEFKNGGRRDIDPGIFSRRIQPPPLFPWIVGVSGGGARSSQANAPHDLHVALHAVLHHLGARAGGHQAMTHHPEGPSP